MNHWIIAPVVLPAFLGPLIVLGMRHDLVLQRVFSTVGTAAQLVIALWLMTQAAGGEIRAALLHVRGESEDLLQHHEARHGLIEGWATLVLTRGGAAARPRRTRLRPL